MFNSMQVVAVLKGWNKKDDSLIETGHYGPSFPLKIALTVEYPVRFMPIVL